MSLIVISSLKFKAKQKPYHHIFWSGNGWYKCSRKGGKWEWTSNITIYLCINYITIIYNRPPNGPLVMQRKLKSWSHLPICKKKKKIFILLQLAIKHMNGWRNHTEHQKNDWNKQHSLCTSKPHTVDNFEDMIKPGQKDGAIFIKVCEEKKVHWLAAKSLGGRQELYGFN